MVLKKKKLEADLQKNWFFLLNHLAAFARGHDQEDLHQLRVEVKKIRTKAWLIQKCLQDKTLTSALRPLKKMFKEAGHIREIYIHEQLSGKNKAVSTVKDHGAVFAKRSEQHAIALARTQTAFTKAIDDIPLKKIHKLFDKEIEKTDMLLKDTKQWHLVRKKIKRLVYIERFLPKKMQKATGINVDYLKQLEDLMGQWHDLDVSLVYLKTRPGSHRAGKTILQKIEMQKDKAEEKIVDATRSFLKQIR